MAKTNCFAHHHMTPAEYGFWQLCRDLSYKTGILYFDGRNMVKRFAGTPRNGKSKHYFYTLLEKLAHKGWFECVQEAQRSRATGMYAASIYRVLSHDQWTAKKGTAKCTDEPESSPDSGTGANSTSPDNAYHQSHCGTIQSPEAIPPVPLSGHNLIGKPDVLNLKAQPDAKPNGFTSPTIGTGVTGRTGDCPLGQQFVPPVPLSGQVRILCATPVPDYLAYDPSERNGERWTASRTVGRPLTADEVRELRRRNKERIAP